MRFGNKWRTWIYGCLSSLQALVILNGSSTKEFDISKGVRHGDPLSPFLFIIAMEGLNISHLFYIDDALFIGEWSRSNLKNLARILRCFHVSSGLKVNFFKSKVFVIGALNAETSNWANILGCVASSLPFTYLEVPVGANMNLEKQDSLGIMGKSNGTKGKWWIGVGSIHALNVRLIVKWWWRLKNETMSLWSQVITGIHCLSNKPYDYLSKKTITGVWKTIAGTMKDIQEFGLNLDDIFRQEIKFGENTMFWKDTWMNNEKLKTKYPSLYDLELRKSCSVVSRIVNTGNFWEWKSCPLVEGLSTELDRLK
uniref:Reverse transcriptase domain-containing protein n=1 Tax=Lactuca sativa TaxID=4236 RepID=A0A9R1UUU0_LACSA|nr:hypothetical protein LSAT_V11C800395240 [Lactuca sativa]